VTATVGGAALVVGTRRLIEEQGVTLSAEAVAALERLDAAGQTSLVVARDGVILGALGAYSRTFARWASRRSRS
jgi:P-type Cu+ transporter